MAETERTVEILPLVTDSSWPEDDDMFTVHCPDHGCEVLLSEKRIRALVPVPTGLLAEWECWCGYRGSFVTGRPSKLGRHRRAVMVGRHRPAV